jgi:hypothetical protein
MRFRECYWREMKNIEKDIENDGWIQANTIENAVTQQKKRNPRSAVARTRIWQPVTRANPLRFSRSGGSQQAPPLTSSLGASLSGAGATACHRCNQDSQQLVLSWPFKNAPTPLPCTCSHRFLHRRCSGAAASVGNRDRSSSSPVCPTTRKNRPDISDLLPPCDIF